MKNRPHAYYPIYLDIESRRCLIIGGGTVALRKALTLLDFGARVVIVSPRLCAGVKKLLSENRIEVLHREFQPGDLKMTAIAIAATASHSTNARVAAEGHRAGVFVNAVDDQANCDFILPAYMRRGGITIAVSTSGMSPALARKIRSRIEKDIGKEYESLAIVVEDVRRQLKEEHVRISIARWQQALDLEVLTELIRKGQPLKAKTVLLRNLRDPSGAQAGQ